MLHVTVDETHSVVATIAGKELRAAFKSDSGSLYTHIEEACDKSMSSTGATIFDWQILEKDPDKDSLVARQVVTDAEFKDGTLKLRYNNKLTDKIIDLKTNYTILSLSETMSIKSVHTLKLHEILKSAYDLECARTKDNGEHLFYFHNMDLKLRLGIVTARGDRVVAKELAKEYPDYEMITERLNKSGDNKYVEYKDFNKSVIKKAVDELNKKTNLRVKYEGHKVGRLKVGINFWVSKADNKPTGKESVKPVLSDKDKDAILDDLYEVMHCDFKLAEIREICKHADFDKTKILNAYEYMHSYNSSIDIPIAFMKSAISNEYSVESLKKITKVPKNAFNRFEQNTNENFELLEKQLLDN